jgi:prolyl-tRNA editing enzyme YbaK/EbsC (Cys-tRNA(Pro) deacylase)
MNLFKEYIKENKLDIELIEAERDTHTAQQAADTHKVPVSNIVKSLLVFNNNHYVLYLVPGDKRLDLEAIGGRMATADEVKEITGYSIGAVPPFGHKTKLETQLIEGFKSKEDLLAAGGKPNIVFKITLDKLKDLLSL